MAREFSVVMLVVALLALSNGVRGKAREDLLDIERKLKLLNKPAIKTIQSEDGDIIDCVDIHKQPAFDHPALKNHTIQMRPNFTLTSSSKNNSSKPMMTQTWQKSGSCPKGTVPIRRIRKQDFLRTNSLQEFGRKPPQTILQAVNTTTNAQKKLFINNPYITADQKGLEIAPIVNRSTALIVTVGYNYIGATAEINVWNPGVDLQDDFTSAQIWLKHFPHVDVFETVESGWAVNPKIYGDRLTRFFAYWTADGYKSTGCFDLTCSGFVHTSSKISLGGSISPISTEHGQQYYIPVKIFLDPNSSNWWLLYGDEPVGYWPPTLFTALKHSAILVEWGGEVYSTNVRKTPHTKTAMGSGDFASALYGQASYFQHIRIKDYSQTLKYPTWVGTWADEEYCYNALNHIKSYAIEPLFYFGGPGQNYNCP